MAKIKALQVRSRDGSLCHYCGIFCPDGTIDHVKPKIQGGGEEKDNLVWACKWCNRVKSDADYQVFKNFIYWLKNKFPDFNTRIRTKHYGKWVKEFQRVHSVVLHPRVLVDGKLVSPKG